MSKGSYSVRGDCESSNPPRRIDSSFQSFICALLVFLGIIILVSLFIMLSSWNSRPGEKEHLNKGKDVEIMNSNEDSNRTNDRLVIVSVPEEPSTTTAIVVTKYVTTTAGPLYSSTVSTTEAGPVVITQTEEKDKFTMTEAKTKTHVPTTTSSLVSSTVPPTTRTEEKEKFTMTEAKTKTHVPTTTSSLFSSTVPPTTRTEEKEKFTMTEAKTKTHVPTTTSSLLSSTSPPTTTDLVTTREVELSTKESEKEKNGHTRPLLPITVASSTDSNPVTTREIELSTMEQEQTTIRVADSTTKEEYTTVKEKTTVNTVDYDTLGVKISEPDRTTIQSDYSTSSTSLANKNYEDATTSISSESNGTTENQEAITETTLKNKSPATQSHETATMTQKEEDANTFSTLDWLDRYSRTTDRDVLSYTTKEQSADLTTHKHEGEQVPTTEKFVETDTVDLVNMSSSTEKEVVIVEGDHFTTTMIFQSSSSSTKDDLENEKVFVSTTESLIRTRGFSPTVTDDMDLKNFEPLCTTFACKSTASRMLGMMNHSSDPCENFYEFACGGAYLVAEESAESTDVDTLSTHLNAVHNSSAGYLRNYKDFYESCVEHALSFRYGERIQKVRDLVEVVGRFEAESDFANYDITDLFSELILRQSMPLFDIGLDVDKQSSNYILQLTLPDESSLEVGLEDWSALSSHRRQCLKRLKTRGQYLDLTKTYEWYLNCQRNYAGYLKSIEDVVRELNVFPLLNSTGLLKEIKDIRFTIEFEFLDQFSKLPSPAAIRKAYTDKEYDVRKVSDLQAQYPIVQWKRLFQTLTGHQVQDNALVQVYLGGYFRQMFQELASVDLRKLKNALLAIYANDLFHKTVIPRETSDSSCLDLTQKLMPDVTANIIQQDYARDEQNYHRNLANGIFGMLKEKFAKSLLEAEWIDDDSRFKFLDKNRKLSLAFFQGPSSEHLLESTYSNLNVTEDFQDNLVNVLVFSRHLKYSLEGTHTTDENIFSYFLNPLDRKPLTFYSNGVIAVPIGLLRQAPEGLPGYVTMARVGFHLAKAMTTHFTPTGMKYGIVLSESSSPTYSELISTTDMMMEHSNSGHMIFLHQNLSFELNGSLFSNEMIADNAAFRLVTDNFNLYGNVQLLPWISSSYSREKTFFIAVAQEYCKRTSVLDFMMQVFESDHLPSVLGVTNLMGHSETFSDKLFECAGGSDMNFGEKLQFPFMQKVEDLYSSPDEDLYRN